MIEFSEDMLVVPELDMITQGKVQIASFQFPVLEVRVEAGYYQDESKLGFKWTVTEMT